MGKKLDYFLEALGIVGEQTGQQAFDFLIETCFMAYCMTSSKGNLLAFIFMGLLLILTIIIAYW